MILLLEPRRAGAIPVVRGLTRTAVPIGCGEGLQRRRNDTGALRKNDTGGILRRLARCSVHWLNAEFRELGGLRGPVMSVCCV